VESGLLLDVIITECPSVFQLLASKDESLLIGRNAFLVLYLGLDIVNRVGRLHLEGDRLPREGLYEDLHRLKRRGPSGFE